MSKQNELAQLADAVTVDGSNVGIGVVPKTWNVYDQAVQIGDGAAIWTYQNAEAHYSVNSYYNSGNKYIGTGTALQYQQAAGAHSFKTATSGTADAAISWNTKVNIDSDGLKFNGDTAAANALSDYEEGTWTPRIVGSSSESGQSYQRQTGHYTKIGNKVFCRFILNFSARGSFSGDYLMDGFPFNFEGPADINLGSLYHSYVGQNVISVGLYNRQNDNKAYIWIKTQAGQSREYPNSSFLTNDTELAGSFTMQTTA